MKQKVSIFISFCLLLASTGSQAALYARDLDGDWSNGHEGVYDDILNITWLASAQAPQEFIGSNTNYNPSFIQSMSIIDQMNASNYFGFTAWRLPKILPSNGESYSSTYYFDGEGDVGFNHSAPVSIYNPYGVSAGSTNNELAFQYYFNLGGISQIYGSSTTQSGFNPESLYGIDSALNIENLALFSNIDSFSYWITGLEVTDPQVYWTTSTEDGYVSAWKFAMQAGRQDGPAANSTEAMLGADFWAVADGDIGTAMVPLPAAVWFFITAIVGLFGATRVGTLQAA